MSSIDDWLKFFFKISTFLLLTFLILFSSWVGNWHLSAEIISVVLILCGYVLFLVLPMKRFKLSLSGFEGDLDRLSREPTPHVSNERVKEVDEQVEIFSENTIEPDLLLMRLSIEIETTLRTISEQAGLKRTKVGIGQLTRYLKSREIITDSWLINALYFFQQHRNELVHEGKTEDIQKAIDIGRSVLAYLKDIQHKE